MTRPLRIEFAGALYHITSRGNRQASIYLDDTDRAVWLQILADVCAHFNFTVHSFCQMTNHYHLLLETPDGGLQLGMRQLNGVYSQYFNRRHSLAGHVFQGRYQAILVQQESYLLEVSRYVVLNPVRARMVQRPDEWPWSSYRLFAAGTRPPAWLSMRMILEKFGTELVDALLRYQAFVMAGIGQPSPFDGMHHQLVLGDPDFVARIQQAVTDEVADDIAQPHRLAITPPLADYAARYSNRDEAISRAYASSAYTINAIARHFKVSPKTVSRAIKQWPGAAASEADSCPNAGPDPGVQ